MSDLPYHRQRFGRRVCVRACVRARARACVCVCARARVMMAAVGVSVGWRVGRVRCVV